VHNMRLIRTELKHGNVKMDETMWTIIKMGGYY
jgi:hypothetical protein